MELGIGGRSALVTGAARGIGRAVAAALCAEGVRVALLDRSAAAVQDAAAALMPDGGRGAGSGTTAFPVAADVTDPAQVAAAVSLAADALDGLDILVSCAGVSGPVGTPLADTSIEEWERVFAVNVTGSFLVLRATLPWLRRSDSGTAVLLASDSALVSTPGMVPYSASKAAVLQLARAASVELAPEGIRVNAICPSIVDTPMSRGDLGLEDGFASADYPVQSAEEVADQVLFLCSPRSRPVNGTALVSDFGYTARSSFPA